MKNKNIYYFVLIIILILFNIFAFVIPTELTSSFWIAYIFGTIAILIQFIFINPILKKKALKKSFYRYSFMYIDFIYVIFQLLIFILIKFINDFPLWLTIILNIPLFGIFITALCLTYLTINHIDDVETKIKEKVNFIRSIQIYVELLLEEEKDEKIKSKLLKLVEQIRYSDPMSSDKLEDLEDSIVLKIKELKSSKDKVKKIEEIELLLKERNKKSILFK